MLDLMTDCSGLALVLALEGHYGCQKVNTWVILLQATINLFTKWLLNLTFILDLIRLLWISLGHELAIMGLAQPINNAQ